MVTELLKSRGGGAHHVGAVHWGGHLDLPEVLPVRQLLGASDGRRAAAVLHVEVHHAVVAAQQRRRRLAAVVPHPVEVWAQNTAALSRPGTRLGGTAPSNMPPPPAKFTLLSHASPDLIISIRETAHFRQATLAFGGTNKDHKHTS